MVGQYMPSAIQVNENEKRKHASLTIAGTKYDFALRVGRAERKPLHGGVTWGAKRGGAIDARYARGKNRWEIEESSDIPPTGVL